ALHDLHGHAVQRAAVAARTREHADARAQRDQLAHDVGADEAGAPGDEDRLHKALASVASAAATVLSAAPVPARSSSRSPSAVARVSAAVTARNGRTRPSSLTAAARAAGIPRSASSDTPRTTAAGTLRPRAHAMMAADSTSAARRADRCWRARGRRR